MQMFFMVAIGGAFGAVFRHYLLEAVFLLFTINNLWGVLIVNSIGSFLFGAVFAINENILQLSDNLKLLITVGLLGSFTTFSTFSMHLFVLLQQSLYGYFMIYLLLSILIGVLGFGLGIILIKGLVV